MHRPSFYAERFQRFMCSTVFKKIPRKWLLADDPPGASLLRATGGRTLLLGLPEPEASPALPTSRESAARPYVRHSVCLRHFQVAAFPQALPACVIEVRGISGKLVGLQKMRSERGIHAVG